MRPSQTPEELRELLIALVDGQLGQDEVDRLDASLRDHPDQQDFYGWFMALHGMLLWRYSPTLPGGDKALTDGRSSPVPPVQVVPAESSSLAGFLPSTTHGAFGYLSAGWPVAYLIATVVLGVGLLIGAFTHVSQPAQFVQWSPTLHSRPSTLHSIVGRITGMAECRFAADSKTEDRRPKTSVSLGDRFNLASGLLEITYDTGARVILQGPVVYEVESPRGGFLAVGKLTARVDSAKPQAASRRSEVSSPRSSIPNPSLSTLNSPLFTVRTPTATVTDLGTEFGIEVDTQGATTSHVFRGMVRVQLANVGGKTQGTGQVLRENESVRVDVSGGQRKMVAVPAAMSAGFIRRMPRPTIKTLDLVDVVAGGNGFSGRRSRGIDPTTGQVVAALIGPDVKDPLSSDGKYHRAQGMPLVDGVFIPDGAKEKVQIDSAGRLFDGFHGTVSRTWQPVWAGGAMRGQDHPTKVWGVDYNSPGHGQILLHASNAITFDLEAIRRANPGCKLMAFRATAGNSDSGTSVMGEMYADFWVLVDGQTRFRRRQIRSSDGAYSVVVPIGRSDRFLTLAATDGGDGYSHDWIIFGDPRLELLPAEKSEQRDTDGL